MKLPPCSFAALGILAIISPCRVNAQVAPQPSSPSTLQNRVLSQDKRLAIIVSAADDIATGSVQRIRIGRLLNLVYKRTRVQLTADYENIGNSYLFASFDTAKASDLMDALAALWLTRWEKDTPNSFKMLGRASEVSDVFMPKDDNTREKYTAGVEFMQGVAALPPGVARDLRSGKKVNINDLPPAVQQSLIGVITGSDKEIAAMGGDSKFPIDKLAQSTLSVKMTNHKEGFSSWFVKIANEEWGDMGTLITDYEQQMKKPGRNINAAVYTPVKFAITQEAARKMPALRQKVNLNLRNATAVEVLQALHKQHGINIISNGPDSMKARKDVLINADTMTEAFDALTKIFPDTQWEYRPSKFFIFRSPNNPAVRATN